MNKLKSAVVDSGVKLPEISPRGSRFGTIVVEAKKRLSINQVREEKTEMVMRTYICAMHANADLASVQEEAMGALCSIIAKGEGIRTLVKTGGVDSIVLAMRLHRDKPELQQRGATALSQVAFVGRNERAAVLSAEALSTLVNGIRAHSDAPAVVERCLNAIATIAAGDLECKRACVEAHVTQVATAGILRYERRANVCIKGLAVLTALTAGDAECRRAVVTQGGVGAICVAMQEHTNIGDAQMLGCNALLNLARGDVPCVYAVVRSVGVHRLVSAMRWYPTQPQIILTVVSALATLSSHDDALVAR